MESSEPATLIRIADLPDVRAQLNSRRKRSSELPRRGSARRRRQGKSPKSVEQMENRALRKALQRRRLLTNASIHPRSTEGGSLVARRGNTRRTTELQKLRGAHARMCPTYSGLPIHGAPQMIVRVAVEDAY
jgi:hypothetical protein